ncbi:MAG: hypothetical protein J2P37_24405 [Ktedonobacteraceae bacterium]|nr:hypothetical protein [Ktedonobacteraceae bacterium]MBO0793531.1 hypothetical protein [Ktedonobacteraceae bacterium]
MKEHYLKRVIAWHRDTILWAREMLERQDTVIIEVTVAGFDLEIIELAAIKLDDTILFHSLIKPGNPLIKPGEDAQIAPESLATAPTIQEIWPQFSAAISPNSSPREILHAGCRLDIERRLPLDELLKLVSRWHSIGSRYEPLAYGSYPDYSKFRTHPLYGHIPGALGQAFAALALVKDIASRELPQPEDENLEI